MFSVQPHAARLLYAHHEDNRPHRPSMQAGSLFCSKVLTGTGYPATSRPGADTLYYQNVHSFIRAYAPFVVELIGSACVAIGVWGMSRKP